jgi:5-bromo-4-chloroindolyl phosphate hydrolysis protein
MEEILKADIFFFITAVAVVVITIVILIAFYYIIKILRDVRELSDLVKDEGKHIIHDIEEAREDIKKKRKSLGNIISSFMTSKRKSKKRT